jgi:hypothetical protein
MQLRYQSIPINLMHNQAWYKDSDLREKTKIISGMHRSLPCSKKELATSSIGVDVL